MTAARRGREDEEMLEAVRAEADDAARARTALFSILSHDLRNPLMVVDMNLRMLARSIAEDHPTRRHTDAIARAYEDMSGIAQALSDSARVEEGSLRLALAQEDVAPMVAAAADAVRRAAGMKDIAVAAGEAEGAVICDRERIERILAGLLASAVQVTPRGGRVAVRAAPDGEGGVRISVTDGGPVIAEEVAARIFELPRPVERGAGGKGRVRHPGMGVVLYAARGVVEAHGGAIAVEPAPGGGNTFTVTLPEAERDELRAP